MYLRRRHHQMPFYVDHHVTKALIGLGRFAGAVNDPTSQMAAACTAFLVR